MRAEVDRTGEVGAETVGAPELIPIRKSGSFTALLKKERSEDSQLNFSNDLFSKERMISFGFLFLLFAVVVSIEN